MITYNFNMGQLSSEMREALEAVVKEFEVVCSGDIDVLVCEFPEKFQIKTFGADSFVLWDPKKGTYEQLPEEQVVRPLPEPKPEPEFIVALDMAGKVIPEPRLEPKPLPELDLSPVVERVEALARALVELTKPLSKEQRLEIWMKFCLILSKEFME